MIEPIPFAIGFVVYVLFCLITFNTYSKNKGMTQAPILFFIYFYYSFLSWYVISLVEGTEASFFVVAIQTLFYIIPCGLLMANFYKKNIKPQDDSMIGQNV
jgi:hypothetical protein